MRKMPNEISHLKSGKLNITPVKNNCLHKDRNSLIVNNSKIDTSTFLTTNKTRYQQSEDFSYGQDKS